MNPAIEIVGVETMRFPSMYHALRGTKPEFGLSTIAEGIAVKAAYAPADVESLDALAGYRVEALPWSQARLRLHAELREMGLTVDSQRP